MKKSIFILTLFFASAVSAQSFKFYWHDRWDSQEPSLIFRYDKLSHGVRDGAIFYCLGKVITKDAKPRFIVTTGFATAYEIWDGFRWRKTGGFSFHDIAAGIAGQAIVFGAEKIFTRKKSRGNGQRIKELEARITELEKIILSDDAIRRPEWAKKPQKTIWQNVTVPGIIYVDDVQELFYRADSVATTFSQRKLR